MMAVEITEEFVWQNIPRRPRDSHKGTFGSVLAVAGSAFYRGAALLAAEGALRTGAGIVTLASVEPVVSAAAACLPECCLCPCRAGAEGGISPENVPLLRRQKATVLLLGPGLGGTAQSAARETQALVQQLLPGFAGSAVLDADGLNAAARLLAEEAAFPHPAGELIVTPHPGEMARLTGLSAAQINADREGTALRYAQAWNAVVVLKGARTVVAAPDGRVCVNPTGNPGLSRGGSGDVLAGMTMRLPPVRCTCMVPPPTVPPPSTANTACCPTTSCRNLAGCLRNISDKKASPLWWGGFCALNPAPAPADTLLPPARRRSRRGSRWHPLPGGRAG